MSEGKKQQNSRESLFASIWKCGLGNIVETLAPVEKVKNFTDGFGKGVPVISWVSKKCDEELDRRKLEELKKEMRMRRQIERELDQEEMSR
ncbi:MAG: hypothetical protein IJ301_03405 [Clostridia bacterium]|nr:hypothetical protein [Clostridia bacterium]